MNALYLSAAALYQCILRSPRPRRSPHPPRSSSHPRSRRQTHAVCPSDCSSSEGLGTYLKDSRNFQPVTREDGQDLALKVVNGFLPGSSGAAQMIYVENRKRSASEGSRVKAAKDEYDSHSGQRVSIHVRWYDLVRIQNARHGMTARYKRNEKAEDKALKERSGARENMEGIEWVLTKAVIFAVPRHGAESISASTREADNCSPYPTLSCVQPPAITANAAAAADDEESRGILALQTRRKRGLGLMSSILVLEAAIKVLSEKRLSPQNGFGGLPRHSGVPWKQSQTVSRRDRVTCKVSQTVARRTETVTTFRALQTS
ncbi:hypothetical protein B0H13DRAFT_1896774 [Mycena leptocephala]|nr:hypothetical protein B0H13DRAFT_1896774 [Mycena leptocephala]